MARERIGLSAEAGTASRFPAAAAETLAGARTLTDHELDTTHIFAFDPGGAGRTVTLPAASAHEGAVVFVANTANGAEVLTIEDDGSNTIVTPTQNEAAVLWSNGTSWFGIVGASS